MTKRLEAALLLARQIKSAARKRGDGHVSYSTSDKSSMNGIVYTTSRLNAINILCLWIHYGKKKVFLLSTIFVSSTQFLWSTIICFQISWSPTFNQGNYTVILAILYIWNILLWADRNCSNCHCSFFVSQLWIPPIISHSKLYPVHHAAHFVWKKL